MPRPPQRILRVNDQIRLAPVPITAARYIETIVPGNLGSTTAALAKAERARMLRLYERFGATLCPVGIAPNRATIWEVRFPPRSPYKDGPRALGSFVAIQLNYERNRRFPGRDPLERGDGTAVHNIEKHIQQEIKDEDQKTQETQTQLKEIIDHAVKD